MPFWQFFIFFVIVVPLLLFVPACSERAVRAFAPVEGISEPITFMTDSNEGFSIAKKEHKPVMLFFMIPDNNASQKMLETTFSNGEVAQLAQRFVCIKVDGTKDTTLCEELGIRGFPTVVLTNSRGDELNRLTGKQAPDHLAVQMHIVLQTAAIRQEIK